MSFEPQKLFIGLVDFFSILLPGAVLAFVVKDRACLTFTGSSCAAIAEPTWVFLFCSYLLGHLVFLLSATLDSLVYDRVRSWTDLGQIKRLISGDDPWPGWKRRLGTRLFGKAPDGAVMQAERMKARALTSLEAEDAINAFQWCKARLTRETAGNALAAVQRFEADAKFFRSFVVVLLALTLIYGHRAYTQHQCPVAALLCLGGTIPALWRYFDQRFKSTQQAYWFVLTLGADTVPAPTKRADGLSHAGGVVFRGSGETTEFMLIEPDAKNRREKLLPKGHIEAGEEPRMAAVREVWEETGNWVKVRGYLGDCLLDKEEQDSPLVRWFLLELCGRAHKPQPDERGSEWLSPKEAVKKATFEETRQLLRRAAGELKISLPDA